jgi:putative two-component system response regulator
MVMHKVQAACGDVLSSLPPVIVALLAALQARDHWTWDHSVRVAHGIVQLGEALRLPKRRRQRLCLAALVHDVGKIGVPDAVLLKPDLLTALERLAVEKHATIGATILAPILPDLVPATLHHHEQWNGYGYPHALKAKTIPDDARMLAVVDAWDAITQDRPYRAGKTADEAREILQAGSGVQWEPRIVAAWCALQSY